MTFSVFGTRPVDAIYLPDLPYSGLQRYYHQYQTRIAALIHKGIERGEFQATDAQEMAIAIMSIYEGLTVLWMLDAATIDLVGVAERTVQSLLESIAKAA